MADIDDEDEVDILGDFSANIETEVDIYEFPTQGSLLGDDLRHPWLLDHSQVLYFDQTISVNGDERERQRSTLDSMLQEEKKHFLPPQVGTSIDIVKEKSPPGVSSKLSPVWTSQDIDSLKKGIEIHGKNWSKIARLIGSKTTLQVKSFLRTHPDLSLMSSSSRPMSPVVIKAPLIPSFTFDFEELIEEAAIPASIEEVIATVTSGQPTVRQRKPNGFLSTRFRSKTKAKSKINSFAKMPKPKRKNLSNPNPVLVPTPVPLITGEIVRLKKENAESSTESDVEIDIDENEPDLQLETEQISEGFVIDLDVPEITEEIELSAASEDTDLNNSLSFVESVEVNPIQEAIILLQNKEETVLEASQAEKLQLEESEETQESQDEPVTFPAPLEERFIEPDSINEEEREVHRDFFVGKSVKTPGRYLRIRNSILEQWTRQKPKYMTKTSVRPALKHCGDVNLIGRIHCYLEQTGAINFGCAETQYGKPILLRPPKERSQSLSQPEVKNRDPEIARIRKRKFMEYGTEGYTVAHDKQEFTRSPKKAKKTKERKETTMEDPFRLIPCLPFSPQLPAPFEVRLSANALVLMDVHSHLCKTEIIGLLGGHYDFENRKLSITVAQPCQSLSTSHQCEMCPVSQTQASDRLEKKGLAVVGWYHSHPTFMPRPSVRDLETQAKFQAWFARNEAPFVGVIVAPYFMPQRDAWASGIRCLTVLEGKDESGSESVKETLVPYKFELQMDWDRFDTPSLKEGLGDIGKQMHGCPTLLPLDGMFKEPQNVTYADKVLKSLARHLSGVSPFKLPECFALVKDFLLQLAPERQV